MFLILEPSRRFGCSARDGCRHSSALVRLPVSLRATLAAPLAPCMHACTMTTLPSVWRYKSTRDLRSQLSHCALPGWA